MNDLRRAGMSQDYTRWFTDYPATHERAGQTVEVTPVAEVERLSEALGAVEYGAKLFLLVKQRDDARAEVDRQRWALRSIAANPDEYGDAAARFAEATLEGEAEKK